MAGRQETTYINWIKRVGKTYFPWGQQSSGTSQSTCGISICGGFGSQAPKSTLTARPALCRRLDTWHLLQPQWFCVSLGIAVWNTAATVSFPWRVQDHHCEGTSVPQGTQIACWLQVHQIFFSVHSDRFICWFMAYVHIFVACFSRVFSCE